MRVRRIRGCSCSGSQGRTYSTLFTNKSPITAELRYLTAKMAALLPFGKADDFLGEPPFVRSHSRQHRPQPDNEGRQTPGQVG